MKITIQQHDLKHLLATVKPAVAGKSTLAILTHVMLTAENGHIRATGTDLGSTLTTTAPGDIATEGAICLPYKRLADIVGGLPDTDLTIEVGEGWQTRISSGRANYKIHGLDPEEWPGTPGLDETASFPVDAGLFAGLLTKTMYAVSDNEMRPNLQGVYVHTRDGRLRMCATDGHRLSVVEDTEDHGVSDMAVIVPGNACQVIARMCADKETIDLKIGEKFAYASNGEVGFTTRLIEGDYESYESVMPQDPANWIEFDRLALLDAARRVKVCADPMTNQVIVTTGAGSLVIETQTAEFGEARDSIPCECSTDIVVALNAQYLIDVLNHIEGDSVRFKFGPVPDGGYVITAMLCEVDGHRTILMPIRVTD